MSFSLRYSRIMDRLTPPIRASKKKPMLNQVGSQIESGKETKITGEKEENPKTPIEANAM